MLKRILAALAALIGAGAAAALAANIPSVPSTSQFSEPSQIVGTLNTLINALQGGPCFSGTPQVNWLGALCNPAAGASPQTCNTQRMLVPFTGITVAAVNTTQTLTINNSLVTTASMCFAQWVTAFTAGSALVTSTVVPSAGSLAILVANSGATTNAVTTGTLAVHCEN